MPESIYEGFEYSTFTDHCTRIRQNAVNKKNLNIKEEIKPNEDIFDKCGLNNFIKNGVKVNSIFLNGKEANEININSSIGKNILKMISIKDSTSFMAIKTRIKKSNKKDIITPFKNITNNLDILKTICFAKVKGYERSGKLFGYLANKKAMYNSSLDLLDENNKIKEKGKLFNIVDIQGNYTCKKDKEKRDIIILKGNNQKSLKFLLEDIELVYPNINKYLKGYKEPKSQVKKVGAEVRILDKTGLKLVGKIKVRLENIGKTSYYQVQIGNNIKVFKGKQLKLI